jgi:hypothetical protein
LLVRSSQCHKYRSSSASALSSHHHHHRVIIIINITMQQAPLPAIRGDIDAVYSRCITDYAPKRAKHSSPPRDATRDATTLLHGLKRESSSLGSSQALPSPVQTVRTASTPATQVPKSAASKLIQAIGTKLPTVSLPSDRCVRCAGAMHAGACTRTTVNKLLYDANSCSSCALPL